MVTVIERETHTETRTGQGSRRGKCDGCPRCDDPNARMCSARHRKFGNLHPVCRVCGHCVLRGSHRDDRADLDDHPGFGNEHGSVPLSRN